MAPNPRHFGLIWAYPLYPEKMFSEGSLWGFSGTSRTRGRLPPAHAVVPLSYEYPVSIFCSRQYRLWAMKTAHAGIALPVWVSSLYFLLSSRKVMGYVVEIGYGLRKSAEIFA